MPRSRNQFELKSGKPFKLSRSNIERFLRRFYLDRRLGVGQRSDLRTQLYLFDTTPTRGR